MRIYYRLAEKRSKDHDETGAEEDVDGLDVGDLGQGSVGGGHERRHGQDGGDAERNPGRRGLPVEPEGNPRDDDDQAGRNVNLDQVVAHRAHELDLQRHSRIVA